MLEMIKEAGQLATAAVAVVGAVATAARYGWKPFDQFLTSTDQWFARARGIVWIGLLSALFLMYSNVSTTPIAQAGSLEFSAEGIGRGAMEGTRQRFGRVTFQQPFSSPPSVLVALAGTDVGSDMRPDTVRLDVCVEMADRRGFNYRFRTWSTTAFTSVRINWIAAPLTIGGGGIPTRGYRDCEETEERGQWEEDEPVVTP